MDFNGLMNKTSELKTRSLSSLCTFAHKHFLVEQPAVVSVEERED